MFIPLLPHLVGNKYICDCPQVIASWVWELSYPPLETKLFTRADS